MSFAPGLSPFILNIRFLRPTHRPQEAAPENTFTRTTPMTAHNLSSKITIILTCTLLLMPPGAMAAGVGFYASTGYGEGGYSGNDASRTDLPDLTYARTRLGGGFVFDNDVAGKSLFNYRINVGAEGVADNVADASGPLYYFSGVRFNWLNDFGFALIQAPGLRWWLGPQQGFFVLDESDASGSGILSFNGALGVVSGVNFNMPRRVSLSVDLALRYVFDIATRAVRTPYESFDASYLGNGAEVGLTFSFLVRGRDAYHRYRR
jgi:hypothetical protein